MTNQLSGGQIKGRIQLSKLIAQLYFAHRPTAFCRPPLFALRAGATTHLILKVDALVIAVFQAGQDFFKTFFAPLVFMSVRWAGSFLFYFQPLKNLVHARRGVVYPEGFLNIAAGFAGWWCGAFPPKDPAVQR
jgi:hypothetical protein